MLGEIWGSWSGWEGKAFFVVMVVVYVGSLAFFAAVLATGLYLLFTR